MIALLIVTILALWVCVKLARTRAPILVLVWIAVLVTGLDMLIGG